MNCKNYYIGTTKRVCTLSSTSIDEGLDRESTQRRRCPKRMVC